jgi:hypothetical protein
MLYIQVKKNNKNIIQKIKNFYLSLYKQRLYALTAYFLKEFKPKLKKINKNDGKTE